MTKEGKARRKKQHTHTHTHTHTHIQLILYHDTLFPPSFPGVYDTVVVMAFSSLAGILGRTLDHSFPVCVFFSFFLWR